MEINEEQFKNIKERLTKPPYGWKLDSFHEIIPLEYGWKLDSSRGIIRSGEEEPVPILRCSLESKTTTPCFLWIRTDTMEIVNCMPVY